MTEQLAVNFDTDPSISVSVGTIAYDTSIEDSIVEKTYSGPYSNPRVDALPGYALTAFAAMTSVDFKNVTSIGSYALSTCSAMTSAKFPKASSVATYAFRNCTALAELNFYSADRTTIPTLANSNALTGTAIASGNGYIVINDDLVDSLKAASNWVTYSSQIIGHTDWQALQA